MTRRLPPIAFILSFCLFVLPARAAEDWPGFRGPTGQGISTAHDVPVEWNARKNIAWAVEIPGRGWSSPVLVGGRIYLTTAVAEHNGGAVSLRVLCLNAADGKGVWDVEVLRPDPAAVRAMHQKNSAASATPLVVGDRIYAHFGHLGTAALDLSGNVIWRQTTLKYPPVHGNGGSPVLVDGLLIFNCDGARDPFIVALDARTGDIKWRTPRDIRTRSPFSFCTPLVIEVGGKQQVISPASGFVGAYDPATGQEIWRVRYGEGYSVVPRPVYSHGLLILSSGFDTPVLYAIRPEGARGDVTNSHVAWTLRKGAPTTPSPVVVGDEVYCVSDGGIATCADVKTGRVHWTHRLNGGFSASPVTAEGRVYFQNETGVGYVIEAGKTFKQLAENDLGERSLASYAVTDGTLFIRTESHLVRVGAGNTQARGR
jgi:outer membrane protein assembly factor BamB